MGTTEVQAHQAIHDTQTGRRIGIAVDAVDAGALARALEGLRAPVGALLLRLPPQALHAPDGAAWVADSVRDAGVDPSRAWLDVGTRHDILLATSATATLAQRHIVACHVEPDDVFGARAALGALAGWGVRLMCIDHVAVRDDGLADAIRTRALCRRAHINGMAVMTRGRPTAVGHGAARALGVDLALGARDAA